MLGAIIGDLAGSIYEFDQIKNCKPVIINKLIEDNSFISDDTILTVAIADAIINIVPYEEKLKEYGRNYNNKIPKDIPYFKTMFSPGFSKWANGDKLGDSIGNGAMMRISPVGYLFDTEESVINNSYLATIPSHNSQEAIESARIVSLIIFYCRQGLAKQEIIDKLNLKIVKPQIDKFNYTCSDTMQVCLYSLFTADSFEESIRLAISFGGDTDTNAAIVGSMAEAMFGISEELKLQAKEKLPKEFLAIINDCYARINKIEMRTM